jgi:hypothetical protein
MQSRNERVVEKDVAGGGTTDRVLAGFERDSVSAMAEVERHHAE